MFCNSKRRCRIRACKLEAYSFSKANHMESVCWPSICHRAAWEIDKETGLDCLINPKPCCKGRIDDLGWSGFIKKSFGRGRYGSVDKTRNTLVVEYRKKLGLPRLVGVSIQTNRNTLMNVWYGISIGAMRGTEIEGIGVGKRHNRWCDRGRCVLGHGWLPRR